MSGEFRRQENTFGHIIMPVGIVTALASLQIEVAADHVGELNFPCPGVAQFNETAFGTAIAQRFPFLKAHLLKTFLFPELLHFFVFPLIVG